MPRKREQQGILPTCNTSCPSTKAHSGCTGYDRWHHWCQSTAGTRPLWSPQLISQNTRKTSHYREQNILLTYSVLQNRKLTVSTPGPDLTVQPYCTLYQLLKIVIVFLGHIITCTFTAVFCRTVNMELLAIVTPESTTVSRFIPSTSEDRTLLQSTQY